MSKKIYNLTTAEFSPTSADYLIGVHDFGDNSFKSYKFNFDNLGVNNNARILTYLDNGHVLLTTDNILYCNAAYSYMTVTLPDASLMINKELTFINIDPAMYEASFIIEGPFMNDETSYNLNTFGHSVTLLCDGTIWWVKSQYIPS